MRLESIQRYLLPGDIEGDPRFGAHIRRLSHIGMQVIGGAQIAVSLFMLAAYLLVDPDAELRTPRVQLAACMIVVGLATFVAARIRKLYSHGRLLSATSALISGAVLTWMLLLMSRYDPTADE